MELERLALQLRPRNPWEAMDLGAAMLREWWRPIYGAWFAVYVPAAVLLHLVLTAHPTLVMFLLWWLKPAFDRIVLHVVAGAVFGAAPAVRDTVRGAFGYARRGLLASLTYYRFDLARSFNLPVWQLEGLRGAAARQRAQTLHRRARSHAVWLTLICLNFELVLFFSIIGLLAMMTPVHASSEWGWAAFFLGRDDLPLWRVVIEHTCYLLAVAIVEPLYVAAGFALYLNRRTQLEAWDVELQLRRLAPGPGPAGRAPAPLRHAAAIAALALILAWGATPLPAPAAESPPPTPAGEAVREVLKDPAFEQWKDARTWRYVGPGLGGDESKREPPKHDGTDWSRLIGAIAELLRILAWAVGAAAIAWLLWVVARYAGLWRGSGRGEGYRPPEALFGLDLRPESLPADVPGVAAALMREGRLREALALLYRGALVNLVHVRHVEIAASDTEGDCVRRVAAATPGATAQYFARLVGAWQGAAYANRLPAAADAETLAREWVAAFAVEPATGTAVANSPPA